MRARKHINWRVRDEILAAGLCAICGVRLTVPRHPRYRLRTDGEIDHITPLVRGGGNDRANLRAACVHCNRGHRGWD